MGQYASPSQSDPSNLSSQSFDTSIRRAITPFDELVNELNSKAYMKRLGVAVETLESLGINSFEELIDRMNNFPPREELRQLQPWLLRHDLLAIVDRPAINPEPGKDPLAAQAPQVLIAIAADKATTAGSHTGGLRLPVDISIPMEDSIRPKLKNNFHKITWVLVHGSQFDQLIDYVNNPDRRREILQLIDPEKAAKDTYWSLLSKAVVKRASDMHIEPIEGEQIKVKNEKGEEETKIGESKLRVRYRVDGVLDEEEVKLPGPIAVHLIQIVKNEAGIDIAESRIPQDGGVPLWSKVNEELEARKGNPVWGQRLKRLEGYNLRVVSIPTCVSMKTANGGRKNNVEQCIIRFHKPPSPEAFKLSNLGLDPVVLETLKRQLCAPQGVILLSGPTGSGKTTTLYACLQELNKPGVKIQTIEDPIEVGFRGLNQLQINKGAGLTFASATRAFLRADPDIILVGEVRDAETAQAIIDAGNTGHLVFSTIHTNDSVSVIDRLIDLKVEKSQLQSSLLSVVSQRLVRRCCPDCVEPYDARNELRSILGESFCPPGPDGDAANQDDPEAIILMRPKPEESRKGCKRCNGIGYKGRHSVAEIWVLGSEEGDLINKGERAHGVYLAKAVEKGMQPLAVSAFKLALRGVTTMSEIIENVASYDRLAEQASILKQQLFSGTVLPRKKVLGGN